MENSNTHSISFLGSTVFKVMLALGVLGVLFMSALAYLQVNTGGSTFTGETIITDADKKIELPAESWYNDSYWSYVSSTPWVSQILKKNKEVSGKEIYPEITNTIQITGIVSAVIVPTYYNLCRKKGTVILPDGRTQHLSTTVSCSDGYAYPYTNVGMMEVTAKKPDKILRVMTTKHQKHQTQKVEEGVSESAGWKKTVITSEREGIVSSVIEDLLPDKILELQKQMESSWQNAHISYASAKSVGMKKVNEEVAFMIVQEKDGKKQNLYFDAVTGYLVKMDVDNMSIYFSDYKDYDGSKLPAFMYYRTLEDNQNYLWIKVEVLSWKFGEFVDDSIFQKPLR